MNCFRANTWYRTENPRAVCEQEGILRTHACIRWTTIAWVHQIWWREIENSRKVSVLLKGHFVGALNTSLYYKKMLSMTKIWRFPRAFSVVDFSAVDFLDLLKTQRQKSLFLHKSDFHWRSNAFLWFFLSRKKCIGVMFSSLRKAKKITTRGLFVSTLSHVKLIAETRLYMPQQHEMYGYFFTVFRRFSRKNIIKNILQEMKNGLSLRQRQLQVIMYCIITWAFHKLTCRQNKCTLKKRTILLFFFISKRYRYFS